MFSLKNINLLNIEYTQYFLAILFTLLEIRRPLNVQLPVFKRKRSVDDILFHQVNAFIGHYANVFIYIILYHFIPSQNIQNFNLLSYVSNYPIDKHPYLHFIIVFICIDFITYSWHRYIHRSTSRLWRIHAIHHSSDIVDWLSSYRAHWLDALLVSLILIPLMLALGASREHVLVFGVIDMLINNFSHANIKIPLGFFSKVINNSLSHRWHHSTHRQFTGYHEGGQNFGIYTYVWDHLFGTFYIPSDNTAPTRYGLLSEKSYNTEFFIQFFDPIIKILKNEKIKH
jgi:sterol desaturase/sphingolipid hydroxylase (fatty acid hydroxylase superfamily)